MNEQPVYYFDNNATTRVAPGTRSELCTVWRKIVPLCVSRISCVCVNQPERAADSGPAYSLFTLGGPRVRGCPGCWVRGHLSTRTTVLSGVIIHSTTGAPAQPHPSEPVLCHLIFQKALGLGMGLL